MVVAIYSRGLDVDQINTISDLLAELKKAEVNTFLYSSLIENFSNKNLSTFNNYSDLVPLSGGTRIRRRTGDAS